MPAFEAEPDGDLRWSPEQPTVLLSLPGTFRAGPRRWRPIGALLQAAGAAVAAEAPSLGSQPHPPAGKATRVGLSSWGLQSVWCLLKVGAGMWSSGT